MKYLVAAGTVVFLLIVVVLTLLLDVGNGPVAKKDAKKRTLPQVSVPSFGGEMPATNMKPDADLWAMPGNLDSLTASLEFQPTPTPMVREELRDLAGEVIADEKRESLDPESLVWVVFSEDLQRVYPLDWFASDSLVLNDLIGETPIGLAIDVAARRTLAFERNIAGVTARFCKTSSNWLGAPVMEDLETGSSWSECLPVAMSGQLKGKRLKTLPSFLCTWSRCRSAFPNCQIAKPLDEPDGKVKQTGGDDREGSEEREGDAAPKSPAADWFSEAGEPMSVLVQAGNTLYSAPFSDLRQLGLIYLGEPGARCVIHFHPEDQRLTAYWAFQAGNDLEFVISDRGKVSDRTTAAEWDMVFGRALGGSFEGKKLQRLPVTLIPSEQCAQLFAGSNEEGGRQGN